MARHPRKITRGDPAALEALKRKQEATAQLPPGVTINNLTGDPNRVQQTTNIESQFNQFKEADRARFQEANPDLQVTNFTGAGQLDATIGQGGQAPQQVGGQFGDRQFGRVGGDVFEIMPDGTRRPVSFDEFQTQLGGLNLEVLPQLDTEEVTDIAGFTPNGDAARDLRDQGAVPTSLLPQERAEFFKTIEDRFKKLDDFLPQILATQERTEKQENLQRKIDQTLAAAEEGIIQEGERLAPIGFITGAQANIERRANAKLAGLQREMTRLEGNKEAQFKTLKLAYDLQRQSITDALALYQATAPDKLFVDENNGIVYFQNPITGDVFGKQIEGFVPTPEDPPTTSDITEYLFAKEDGSFAGDYAAWKSFKATQFGTEGRGEDDGSDDDIKLVRDFNKSLSSWNLEGTREQFIRQLQARFPEIDPNDIGRKVYETYPDNFDK